MKLTFFQSHQSLLIFVGTFFSWACYVRSGHKLWPTTVFWWRMLRHRSKNEVHKFDYIIDTWIHDMTTHSHNSLKIYCYSNAKWTTCKMFMVEYFSVDWNWIVTGYTQNIFFGKNEEIALARVKVGSFVLSPLCRWLRWMWKEYVGTHSTGKELTCWFKIKTGKEN